MYQTGSPTSCKSPGDLMCDCWQVRERAIDDLKSLSFHFRSRISMEMPARRTPFCRQSFPCHPVARTGSFQCFAFHSLLTWYLTLQARNTPRFHSLKQAPAHYVLKGQGGAASMPNGRFADQSMRVRGRSLFHVEEETGDFLNMAEIMMAYKDTAEENVGKKLQAKDVPKPP